MWLWKWGLDLELNWLHLSDIHFNYENYDTKKMRHELIKYLNKLNKDIQFIVITGDIVYQNGTYTRALVKFLEDIRNIFSLNNDDLYIVPGNHDLKRGGTRGQIVKSVTASDTPLKELENLDSKSYKLLLSEYKKYSKFHMEFFSEGYPNPSLHYVKKENFFNIIHINTCVVSGLDKEEGKLLIDHNKLFDVLKAENIENEDKINIAIGHHSIDCLHPDEKNKFLHTLSDFNIDMYFCGHYHKPSYDFNFNNENCIYEFVTGGNIVDGYCIPCFIQGTMNIDNGNTNIKYHRWYDDHEYWDSYSGVGRVFKNGEYNFELKKLQSVISHGKNINVDIDEDNFKKFIIDFHNFINQGKQYNKPDLNKKELEDKFINMKCSLTLQKEFDAMGIYFPIIEEIMESGTFIDFDKKIIIPGVIISEYNKVYNLYNTGAEIIEAMIYNIYEIYENKLNYSESRLKTYIKILIYWTIYDCGIFNEKKGE